MKKLLMIMAIAAVIGMAGTAMAAPDLSAPGSFYVDLDNGGNNDGPANGWLHNTRLDVGVLVNDTWMRYGAGDTEFKMTVTGLTPGGLYDVAALYIYQQAANQTLSVGLMSGVLTDLNMSNGTSTTIQETGISSWFQVQSDPGIIGVGTAVGGNLDIFFAGDASGGEAFADGVVLTPIPIPEPAGLGLIGLALLAVRKRRS